MQWNDNKLAIVTIIGAVAVAAFSVIWIGKRITHNNNQSESGLLVRNNTISMETHSKGEPCCEDFTRIANEVMQLRTEVKRLDKSLTRLMARMAEKQNQSNDDAVSTGWPTREKDHPVASIDAWEIERLEREETEKLAIKMQQQVEQLDAIIQQETIDTAWAGEAITYITSAIEGSEFRGSSLIDVNCRSTACRATFLHESRPAVEEFQLIFSEVLGELFPEALYTHFDLDGEKSETVVHFARKGYSLPKNLYLGQ